MTGDEFEQQYAARSGVTIQWLHDNHLHAMPCDCGETVCEGWAMDWERRQLEVYGTEDVT